MGNNAGIPVRTDDIIGVIIPPIAPYWGPQIKPIKNTGKCIGKRIVPGIPNACPVKYGIIIPSATNKAVSII